MLDNRDIAQLRQRGDIWQASQTITSEKNGIPTGFQTLDQALALGGWPPASTTEILLSKPGIGELRLLLPALSQLSQNGQWVAWVDPPYIPYAPTLHQAGINLSKILVVRAKQHALWAVEQALRLGCCRALLSWDKHYHHKDLRRLQLAAKQGRCWHIHFRSSQTRDQASPAALRLQLNSVDNALNISVIKQPQHWSGQIISLPLPQLLQTTDLTIDQWPIPSANQIITQPTVASTKLSTITPSTAIPPTTTPTTTTPTTTPPNTKLLNTKPLNSQPLNTKHDTQTLPLAQPTTKTCAYPRPK